METKTIDYTEYYPKLNLFPDEESASCVIKDDMVRIIEAAVRNIELHKIINIRNRTICGFDAYCMLATIFLGYALNGHISTRKLAEACKFDIRYNYLMRGEQPSHMAFQRFIHDDLGDRVEKVFYALNKYIEKVDSSSIDFQAIYIDGTKWEANANKFSFIWGKNTHRFLALNWEKLTAVTIKINKYIKDSDFELDPLPTYILKRPEIHELMDCEEKLLKLCKRNNIKFVYGSGKRKHVLQRFVEEYHSIIEKLLIYTIQESLLDGHNSCSKVDPDCSYMHALS